MGLPLKHTAIYTLLLGLGCSAGWAGSYLLRTSNQPNRPAAATPTPTTAALRRDAPASNSTAPSPVASHNFIAAAVEKVGPAVVRIDASRTVSDLPNSFQNPFFRRFFGENEMPSSERVEQGTGSGFIISTDGQLITNAHVVEGADVVTVTLKDGRTFDGKVMGVDPITDVAAVKIEAAGLPTVSLGTTTNLIPGQWAIAIGNPLGLDNSVTAGIISATGRSSDQVGIPDRRVRFIQTDAAINPGNSGGPLLNDRGEVIGINTAIRANAQGLGFAIPIETGQRIAQQLFAKGKAEHPYLGIEMIDLTAQRRDQLNQDEELNLNVTADKGVLIVRVADQAPAMTAGILAGDIVTKVNGVPVPTASNVQEQIEATQIGQEVAIEVQRNNQVLTLQVRPIAFPVEEAG